MCGSATRLTKKGDQIYAAGDKAGRLVKVCSGAVMLYVILEDGRRQIVDLAGPGDLLHFEIDGELDHFAEALAATELAVMDGAEALGDPSFLPYFLEQMRARISLERRHIAILGRKSAQQRVADFLEYVSDCLNCPPGEIDLPMTRQQIADYLGLTLETVSRIFAKWVREGRLVQVDATHYELTERNGTHAPGPSSLCRLLAA